MKNKQLPKIRGNQGDKQLNLVYYPGLDLGLEEGHWNNW